MIDVANKKVNKIFCEHCMHKCDYKVIKAEMMSIVKGKEYKFKGIKLYCKQCGCRLFPEGLYEENLKRLNEYIKGKR